MSDPIVGIDLGTSNTVVAHADATGSVQVLADDERLQDPPVGRLVPPERRRGRRRRRQAAQGHRPAEHDLLGQAPDRPRLQRRPRSRPRRRAMPYQIKEGANQLPLIVTRGGEFAVPEISAIVLDHVRNIARRAARHRRSTARSSPCRRASTTPSARRPRPPARSPASPSCACSTSRPPPRSRTATRATSRQMIAVYDFGGGTFDITILKLARPGLRGARHRRRHVPRRRRPRRAARRSDGRRSSSSENRIDLRTNEVSMMRLRAVAEQTKIELSRRSRAVVRDRRDRVRPERQAARTCRSRSRRDEFVSQVADIIDRTFPVCKEALQLRRPRRSTGIDDVILVGGTTKIPYVRDQVSKFFEQARRAPTSTPRMRSRSAPPCRRPSLERILSRRTSSRIPVPPVDQSVALTLEGDLLDMPTIDTSLTDVLAMAEPSIADRDPGAEPAAQDRAPPRGRAPRAGAARHRVLAAPGRHARRGVRGADARRRARRPRSVACAPPRHAAAPSRRARPRVGSRSSPRRPPPRLAPPPSGRAPGRARPRPCPPPRRLRGP